jgi:1-phosphofructokinase
MTARRLTVFDPAPRLSIHLRGSLEAVDEVHLHAGGQGIWIARMARVLGASPCLCGPFGDESGAVIAALLADEGIATEPVRGAAANGVSVHAGHEGDPETAMAGTPDAHLDRHALDALYNATLASALDTRLCVLAGVADDDVIPADTFRRLTVDLRANDVRVVADLSGDQLEAVAVGGIDLVKVSDEDLLGRERPPLPDVVAAVETLLEQGARNVVVSRAAEGAYAWIESEPYLVTGPDLEVVNPRGAGDAMTGAMAATLAAGGTYLDAVRLAAAAGAANVTRHGMATGDRSTIERLADRVAVEACGERSSPPPHR